MTKEEILAIFQETGALLDGHFQLTSGLHSAQYFQCALVLQDPIQAQKLCWEIACKYMSEKIDVVVGPAIGGIVVAQEVARLLSARAIFAEREDGKMTLRRGFQVKPGEKVLVVEDVVTTGGSIKEVIDLVRKEGGEVKGAGFLVNRSQGKVTFDLPVFSVFEMDVITYDPKECPLCEKRTPLTKPGSRK
ncbi:orotate phosphoribosyltransferase [candidate division KSB1 bacterium 4572_119]|nr:MAG: orotate phosphoribosyltransferase [candidate division KSB1 bacterium 4572_119]